MRIPGSAVENPMVVGEPPFPAEPRDPQEAGHGALARGENGADQQQLGMAPCSLLPEHRSEGWDDRGEAGWQVHGGVSWRGRTSLPPTRSAAAPHANRRQASTRLLNGQRYHAAGW